MKEISLDELRELMQNDSETKARCEKFLSGEK